MLVPLIANNQNVVPAVLPLVKIDRGGGGAQWPGYQIVDLVQGLALFPEIAGEDTVARAVRRKRFLDEILPRLKEAREGREGAVFLAGAQVGWQAALEQLALDDRLSQEEAIRAFDAARAKVAPAPAAPSSGIGFGGALLLVGLGIGIGLGIARRRQTRLRR